MKKFVTVALALTVLASFAVDAQAKRNRHNHRYRHRRGAEKVGLFELLEGDDPGAQGTGDKAGFAVLNTTAEGVLIVNVKIKGGVAETTYNVTVTIDGVPTVVGQVTTNKKGKGTGHFEVDVSASYPGESIEVQVAVTPAGESVTLGYSSTPVPVALKPMDVPE